MKLAIIGASYLQEPIVYKAKELNIETHCFAWDEGATCKNIADYFYPISIVEKELILEKCKQIGIDGITSIASDVAVPTVCYVAEKMGLVTNSYPDSIVQTNKYQMRKRFIEFGVRSPKFIVSSNNLSIDGFSFPLIVKPTDRSGSLGVKKVTNRDELFDAVERAKKQSFSKEAIIEEFVSGHEISVETISWKGEHYVLAITDKVTTGNPYYVELEHHQPSILAESIINKIKVETKKALSALNVNFGASHSEFMITENGEVYAIEVGARMGGDFIGSTLVYLSTGYDFVKGIIEVALGTFEKPQSTYKKCSGVYFLSEVTKRVLPYIQNAANHPFVYEAKITNEQLKKVQSSSERSGYFIYQSDKKIII